MQILTTSDGSHTLFSEQFNEIYHSTHGAIQESSYVYIKQGLEYVLASQSEHLAEKCPIKVFEVGFGTGLNTLLTFIKAKQAETVVNYETIELFPVSVDTIRQINYTAQLGDEIAQPVFQKLHLAKWNQTIQITDAFILTKYNTSLSGFALTPNYFHLIYFDAFAPDIQPEIWSGEIMKEMYKGLIHGGILVSYCSKSSFQKALKRAGFRIEKLPGPKGKREMIRAIKMHTNT